MSAAKHTPGPWHYTVGGNGYSVVGAPYTFRDGSVISPLVATVHGMQSHNADLIAAAPKLYALAQQYASECGECAGTGVCPDDEPCEECLFIRVILDEINGKAVQP